MHTRNELFLTMLLLLFIIPANAGTISWVIPTTRTDGTTLLVTEIGKYQLFVDNVLTLDNLSATTTSASLTLNNGTHILAMRTVDLEGRVGPFSAALSVEIKSPPNAPTTIKFVP